MIRNWAYRIPFFGGDWPGTEETAAGRKPETAFSAAFWFIGGTEFFFHVLPSLPSLVQLPISHRVMMWMLIDDLLLMRFGMAIASLHANRAEFAIRILQALQMGSIYERFKQLLHHAR